MALETKRGQETIPALFSEVFREAGALLIDGNSQGSPEQQAEQTAHLLNELRSWLTVLEDSDLEIDSEDVELKLEDNEVKVVVRCNFDSTAKEKLMRANAAQGVPVVTSTTSQENGSTMKMKITKKIVLRN